ncbi:MAG: helix-turn-helix domain-containing protein [Propionibacteriaceae bacterium]|jgi:AraC-like DNA-binding protein|nr:helix-turn-helix domain-containing protein [Propionibacteriaceae bacterium]
MEALARAAADWTAVSGVSTCVFGFAERGLIGGTDGHFCTVSCPLAADGTCDPQVAHRFGSYEAERWGGEYIYYCPASLVFAATLTWEDGLPTHGLVCGPIVMGPAEDLLGDFLPQWRPLIATLPVRTPAQVGSLARVQRTFSRALADAEVPTAHDDAVPPGAPGEVAPHLVAVEQRLVAMIRRGDKAGAAGLINQLLGALYLATAGDAAQLRQGAAELVTLFSRAAIDGGADADAIFGEKRVLDARLASCGDVDDLSGFLVSVFNRFVGYVFDFSQFQHANALRKAVDYVRGHYREHITLAEVAREVFLSRSYLSSVFSAEMGMSLTAYLRKVRVDKAKQLLLGTDRAVADIAATTGFADQSHFTRVFTKHVGVSPTQFRRTSKTDTNHR